jgi:hypothetical protein
MDIPAILKILEVLFNSHSKHWTRRIFLGIIPNIGFFEGLLVLIDKGFITITGLQKHQSILEIHIFRNLGLREGLPVDLAGLRLLNRLTRSTQGIWALNTTQRLDESS